MTEENTTVADATEISKPMEGKEYSPLEKSELFLGRVKARRRGGASGNIGVAILTLLVAASYSVLAGLFWFSCRPDRDVKAAASPHLREVPPTACGGEERRW